MEIYTSTFAKFNSLSKSERAKYAWFYISNEKPSDASLRHIAPIEALRPTWPVTLRWKTSKQQNRDWAEYSKAYKKGILGKLSKEGMIEHLEYHGGGKDCVLLCYEMSREQCHRSIVGDWLGATEL